MDVAMRGREDGAMAPSPARVLLIEDDLSLREAMVAALTSSGYDVSAAADGLGLEADIDRYRPDVAILDVGLPRGPDGFDVAAALRRLSSIPFMFVTAADSLDDRLRGFDLGGDDYLVKPFAMSELLVRLRALLRRAGRLNSPTLQVRDLIIDEDTRLVRRGDRPIELTKTEFDLLTVLARSPGRVHSKVQLLSLVWGFDQYDPNLVEVHVSALRRKVEVHGPRLIHTERGEGYVVRP
jgi:two-component system, OmpR family, response regulator